LKTIRNLPYNARHLPGVIRAGVDDTDKRHDSFGVVEEVGPAVDGIAPRDFVVNVAPRNRRSPATISSLRCSLPATRR
jgi:hypothetical protein